MIDPGLVKNRRRRGYRPKPVTMEELARTAKLLGLRAWAVRVRILGTDMDLMGVRGRKEIESVVVEAKAVIHEGNIQHAINQLHFRKHFFNRVYVATRGDSVWYALALVPDCFGVIDLSAMRVVRESRMFLSTGAEYLKRFLLGI